MRQLIIGSASVALATIVLVTSLPSHAQRTVPRPNTVQTLLVGGYEIKSVQVLGTAILILQKGNNAFVCMSEQLSPDITSLGGKLGSALCDEFR
jgi:hypothetical protein